MNNEFTIKKLEKQNEISKFYPILLQLFDYLDGEKLNLSVPILLSKGICFLGLFVGDKPAGFLQYHVDQNLENYTYLVIDELVIDEKFRGNGLGSALLDYIDILAHENNVDSIGLLSGISRETAHTFYEKNGFEYRSKWFTKKLTQ